MNTDQTNNALGNLFKSLQPGDVLSIPVTLPIIKESIIIQSVVLRLGANNELYISEPDRDRCISKPFEHNPFHWDDEKNALVDSESNVPKWYSNEIQVERGADLETVERYNKVPRSSGFFKAPADHLLDEFLKSDLPDILYGIVNNGESGTFAEQISLAFDAMGIKYTEEQFIALSIYITILKRRMTHCGTITVEIRSGDEEECTQAANTKH